MVTINYFGRLRENLGVKSDEIDLPIDACDANALREILAAQYGEAGQVLLEPCVRVVINQVICPWSHPISKSDEVAFIPPVSGG